MTAPLPVDPAVPPAVPAPPVPVPVPPAAPPAPPADPAPADPVVDPDGGEPADIAKVRREAAGYRTRLREQEAAALAAQQERDAHAVKLTEQQAMIDAILKAAGVKGDEPADPVKLAEQLAAEQAKREADVAALTAQHEQQVRDLTVRAALPAAAAKAGVDAAALADSMSFRTAAAQLDPASDTFAADLESAVAAAAEANPKLKTAPVAVRSGSEITGRSGGVDQLTREQVAELRKKDPEGLVQAMKDGRLRSLGVG